MIRRTEPAYRPSDRSRETIAAGAAGGAKAADGIELAGVDMRVFDIDNIVPDGDRAHLADHDFTEIAKLQGGVSDAFQRRWQPARRGGATWLGRVSSPAKGTSDWPDRNDIAQVHFSAAVIDDIDHEFTGQPDIARVSSGRAIGTRLEPNDHARISDGVENENGAALTPPAASTVMTRAIGAASPHAQSL